MLVRPEAAQAELFDSGRNEREIESMLSMGSPGGKRVGGGGLATGRAEKLTELSSA